MTYNFYSDKFSKPEIYTRKGTSLVHILFHDTGTARPIFGVYEDKEMAERDARENHLSDWYILSRQFNKAN